MLFEPLLATNSALPEGFMAMADGTEPVPTAFPLIVRAPVLSVTVYAEIVVFACAAI
jgi:hypothetical protein